MPFTGVSALLCLHRDQAARAPRSGSPDHSAPVLPPASPRPPRQYLASMLAGALLIGGPYADELLHCLRGRRA